MLTAVRSVPDLVDRVYSPVASQLVRNLLDEMGAGGIFNNRIYMNADHTAPAHTTNENNKPMTETEDRLNYTQSVSINPANLEWDAVYHESVTKAMDQVSLDAVCPVWYHHRTGSALTEYGQPCALRLECSAHIANRSLAHEFLTGIYTSFDVGELMQRFDLAFDYKIPPYIYGLLYMICKMEGYPPENYFQFLQNYSAGSVGLSINKLDTDRRDLIVRKHITDVLVKIECDADQPEPVTSNQSVHAYNVPFNVTAQFVRPVSLYMRYPITIQNRMVPGEAVDIEPEDEEPIKSGNSPFFVEHAYRELLNGKRQNPIETLKVPWYDQWRCPPGSVVRKTGFYPFATIVFTIDDENNPQGETVIDLEDLGDISLVPEVLDEIKNADYNLLQFSGKYNISVFVDDVPAEPEGLTLESNNTVLHVPNRELEHTYRLVLSVNHDIWMTELREMLVFYVDVRVR